MEYGAPLIHCFKVSAKQSNFYMSMDFVEKESIAWVLSSQTRIHNMNRSVLGALPVDERFSHLRTMFEEHLSTLNSDNPLRKLLDSGIKFTSKELLFHLSKDKRYQGYLRVVDEPSPAALRSYLLRLRQEFIYRKGGILVSYRYHFNRWFAADVSYGWNRDTQQNISSSGSLRSACRRTKSVR